MTTHVTFQQTNEELPLQNKFIKFLAYFFSVAFHPLFVPLYVVAFLVYCHPSYFTGISNGTKLQLILATFLNTVSGKNKEIGPWRFLKLLNTLFTFFFHFLI